MADAFLTRKGGENVTPEVTEQETIIQNITEALVGKVYGANATPETILKGYSAYVHQELVEGTLTSADLIGVECVIDTFTLSARTAANTQTLTHSLGEVPSAGIIIVDQASTTANDIEFAAFCPNDKKAGTYSSGCLSNVRASNGQTTKDISFVVDANTVKINTSSYYYKAGAKYTIITFA